jgi:hypothetical protein
VGKRVERTCEKTRLLTPGGELLRSVTSAAALAVLSTGAALP